jgi:hypothetical protein
MASRSRKSVPGEDATKEGDREAIRGKSELKWWLIYGPPRTGTSYMLRLVRTCSVLYVSDWGLAPILVPIPNWLDLRSSPEFDYIKFDTERFLRDISDNILANAYRGEGDQLDLVYKQANLDSMQYRVFVKMWGPPERRIFCLREPAGYIASARKKFVHESLDRLQEMYVTSIDRYEGIGGDVFEYNPESSVSDYVSFLEPLNFEGKHIPPFHYKGQCDRELTRQDMWVAYRRLAESHSYQAKPCSPADVGSMLDPP